MKVNIRILCLLLLSIGIYSCQDDDKEIVPDDYFEAPSPDSLYFNTDGGDQTLQLKTNLWVTPELDENAASWCEATFYPGKATVVLKIEPNLRGEARETVLKLKTDLVVHQLYIKQLGQNPAIQFIHDTYRVSQSETCLAVPFVSNVTVEAHPSADWITVSRITQGLATDTLYLKVGATTQIRRTADIEINSTVDVKGSLHIIQQTDDTVYQAGEPENYMHKIPIVRAESNVDSEDITSSYDGNDMTVWSGGTQSENFPVDVTYYFASALRVDRMSYSPGMGFGPLKKFEVYYKPEGGNEFVKYGDTYDFQGSRNQSSIVFDGNGIKTEAIRLHILEGTAAGEKQFISIGEIEYFGWDADLTDIFTDKTCSKLREGVVYEQIENMSNRFLQNIAKYLYAGVYPVAARIGEYEAYSDPLEIEKRYKINRCNRLDNATGIYVEEGDELVILCGDTYGKNLKISVMDWNSGYSNIEYNITEGYNELKMSTPGLVYLLYYDENPVTAPKIKLHIATGKINGKFVLNQNTNEEWNALLSGAAARHFDILGEHAQMVMPVNALQRNVKEPSRLLEDYDRMVRLERELMGLYKYNIPIKNRMFFHSIEDSYMYATWYRTAYNENTLDEILDVEKFESGESLWGPAHEVGHMHQIVPGLKWLGMTEVTNNIFAMYVQRSFGVDSRLIYEKIDEQTEYNRYEKAFTNMIAGEKVYNLEDDVFCKLVPFWQLHLYATEIAGCPDFYKDIHEMARNLSGLSGETLYGACQLNFIEESCRILGEDMTAFFEAWGFLKEVDETIMDYQEERFLITADMVQAARDKMAGYPKKLKLKGIVYLTDENISLFKENKPVIAGSVSRSGQQIVLSGWQNAVAYELWEGDRLLSVRQKESFQAPESIDWNQAVVKGVAADGTRTAVNVR